MGVNEQLYYPVTTPYWLNPAKPNGIRLAANFWGLLSPGDSE